MITFLKKINRYLIYAFIGVMITFAMLSDLLMLTNTTAYSSGTTSSGLLIPVIVFSVLLLGLLAKLLVYVSYRIDVALFAKKSGLLYPFPVPFSDFEVTACAFLIPGLFLCGLVHLPVLFFPSLARVLGALRALLLWGTITAIIGYLIRTYRHDYDKQSLAYSLVLLPMILLTLSFVLTIVEVVR